VKILVVTATEAEAKSLSNIKTGHTIDYLVTGPGMLATSYKLASHLKTDRYDLCINCGLAGSFRKDLALGEVVLVTEDIVSELGAEDDNRFLTLADIGLEGTDTFRSTFNLNGFPLRKVKSITVNTVHGNEDSINRVSSRLNPDTESMEGAAFFHVCMEEKIPAIQLRAISNYVERRNRESWKIEEALSNLRIQLEKLLNQIN